jgi:Rrf2 family protein
MDRIVNVSDKGNAAIHALALAAAAEGGRVTAAGAARELGISPSYFAKVLQSLVRCGFLGSTRGAAGGFELARDAGGISCLEVLEAMDGPLPERGCLFREVVCAKGGCALKVMCDRIAKSLRSALESTSIAAIAASFK